MDFRPLIPASSHLVHEVRPGFGADSRGLLSSAYPAITAHESVLRDYLRVLVKRKWIVISCFVIIPTLVLLASLRMTRIYEAAGRIAINRVDTGLMSLKDNGGGSDYSDPAELDTEVSILQSDLLALQVIRQLNLDRNPQFGGSATVTRPTGLAPDPLMTDSAQTSALLARFHGGLRVAIKPNTRIIELRYASPDPKLAAQVINTLAATYVEQNFKTKYESTLQASDWLSKQLVDLQMKVETSQEKLVKYQKDHEILGIDEKQNIITSKLDELNRTLTGAEADRMQKEAVYRQVEAGDPDAVAAAVGPSGAGGSSATASLLDRLRGQRSDLRIQVAELSTQLGPSYPKVVQMNNQLRQVEAEISAEIKKVVAGIRDQYETALQREQLLHAALEKQKQEANKLNEGAIEYTLLRRDVESNRQLYEGLLAKLKEAGVTAGLRSNNFRIVDAARIPTTPSEPNIPRNLAFAIVLGLTSGIGLAFLLESLDNTVRTTDQAQMISGLPSLGMIPLGSRTEDRKIVRPLAVTSGTREAVELITQARPQSQMAESYRALRTSLLLSSLGAPPRILLITSALPQEGKTTTSINTAVVLAQKGVRVLLIDADLRRPSIHKTLGMGPRSGLSNVLTGTAELQQAIVRSPIMPNLFILPAGTPPPNPAELLASVHMKTLLTQLREQYDHIVIDTPPTLSVTDAVVLSTRVDTVVLVIRSGQTTKTALRRARDLLLQVNARVAGVLLNAVDLSSPDYYYYYEYRQKYGGSYYSEDGVSTSKEESARQASTGSV
jgi:succinoglycan biosynthesis transport protein ExoP